MKTPLRRIRLPGRLQIEFAEPGERGGLPVIALHGLTDSGRSSEPVLPQAMRRLVRAARFVEYADAGHAMHWEESQRFALDRSRFAHSVAAAAASA